MSRPEGCALGSDDVTAAAGLHVRAFPHFFLTSLGERFLREFYRAFVADPDAVAVVARNPAGEVVGVVVGTVAPERFFRRMVRRQLCPLSVASLIAVIRHPTAVVRLLRGLTYRGEVPVKARGALLSSICVDPAVAASGIGRQLMTMWWSGVRARGVTDAYLTTDTDGNERVNRFYRQAGWALLGSYVARGGRRMNCYGIHADQTHADPVLYPGRIRRSSDSRN